jgi:4-amino-4-deoxy-L-arabinose transferase-like glycosyltransferase
VDAWNIARTGHDHLGNLLPLGAQEAFGDWISPLLTYLELPAVALFGPAPLVGRLVTAVFGALAAPLIFVLARALRLPTFAAICAGLVVALSPWQIFMSRIALPGALIPACWTLCLLAGLLLIGRGGRREALALALAAGLALYAYPTLKLAAPLLVAWAVSLALLRHGWGAARRWLPAALLLALLWLPFAYVTLFNSASSTRLSQAAIRADSWSAWLAAWWNGYSVYFRPSFYLISGDGDSIRGIAGYGVELAASAALVVLGLLALAWRLIADCRLQIADLAFNLQSTIYNLQWWSRYLRASARCCACWQMAWTMPRSRARWQSPSAL